MRSMSAARRRSACPQILRAAFLGILLSAIFPLTAAAVVYVDRYAPGPTHNGASWATAYTTLREGLSAVRSGGDVWLAKGVYYPDDGWAWDGSRFSTFFLEWNVRVYGGFDPAAGADTMEERNPSAYVTVLSGDLSQNDIVDANGVTLDWSDIVGTDNAYAVVTCASNGTMTIDGVTITAGLEDGSDGYTSDHFGAGLRTMVSSTVTLNKVIFRGNRAFPQSPPVNATTPFKGGAAYFSYGTENLTDVAFIGNSACAGGGVYSMGGVLNYNRVVFEDNDVSRPGSGCSSITKTAGGGLYIEPAYFATTATLQNVQFNNNTATEGGGGLYSNRAITLTNASFNGNTVGGGMFDHGCSTLTDVTFTNNINEVDGGLGGGLKSVCTKGPAVYERVSFIGNRATKGGGLFFNRNTADRTLDIHNAVFAGNQATGEGGGIYVQAGANNELRLTNTVLRGNEAASGGGIYGFNGCAALKNSTIAGNRPYGLQSAGTNCNWVIGNSIIWGNDTNAFNNWTTLGITYSVIEGGCPAGATCDHVLSADPAFRTPVPIPAEDSPTNAGDVHITAGSLAIDAGDNSVVPAGITVDLDQQSRFVDIPGVVDSGSGDPPIVDIGPYEYDGPNQTITFLNPGPQNFGTAPTLTASASSGLTVQFSSSTTGVCTITSSGTLAFVTIGTCTIDANQPGDLEYTAAPTVSQSFTVNPVLPDAPVIGSATAINGRATVSFTAPSDDGGSPVIGYTAKSDPGGLVGTGAASPVTVYGLTNDVAYTFIVRATNAAGSGNWSAASNSVTPVGPQSQTITFEPLASYSFGTSPTLTATATSGLPVTFTSSSVGVCTITSEGTLTFLLAGDCTINADQEGLADYFLAAPRVTRSFTVTAVAPGPPTGVSAVEGNAQAVVSFTPPVYTGGQAPTLYTATSNPGGITGTAASSPITVTGLTNFVAYTFTVTATNSGGTSGPSDASAPVTPWAPLPQTIAFANPGTQTYGTPMILTATATSGLPVSFSSSTMTVCTTSTAGALSFLRAGTCIINADQPGNTYYLAAPRVTQSFLVSAVVPAAPWGVVAAAENAQAIVQFGVPSDGGAPIISYTVTSDPEAHTATGASSPITVTGLTNGTTYTFTVIATNSAGDSPASPASNAVTPNAGGRIYVDRNAVGSGDGSSWENAYTKLQDGLHHAAAGDEIWVAEGVYYPDEGVGMIDNKVDQYFWIPSAVKVYGGFDGADRAGGGETLLSERDWTAHRTILSGDIDQNDTNGDGNFIAEVYTDIVGSNADGVIEASNTNAATRLDGFVITAGNARATGSDGGGIWANASRATYANLEVRGNTAYAYGGGMFEASGAVRVENTLFSGNDANGHPLGAMGGGYLHLYDGHPVFVDVTFSNNTAARGGAGLGFQNGAGTILGCTFNNNNSPGGYGGAISAWDAGTIEMVDTTVSANSSIRGGGIYMFRSGTLVVRDSLFTGNTASESGGGIKLANYPSAVISNSIFTDNSAGSGGGVDFDAWINFSVTNSLFTGNFAGYGGGLRTLESYGTVTNCTFAGNSASNGAAIGTVNGYERGCPASRPQCVDIVNSILWSSAGSEVAYDWGPYFVFTPPWISYSDIKGGWAGRPGIHNINIDPLFASGSRLGSGSPAIDAGDNSSVPEGLHHDLDGHARFVDDAATADTGNGTAPIVDMGAYEFGGSGVPPVLTDVPASATIPELEAYAFTAHATDADIPPQTLTFSLVGAPDGASIDSSTGEFTWTPTEEQGGVAMPYSFTVRVSDGTMNTDQTVELTVTEVNTAPVITSGMPSSPWHIEVLTVSTFEVTGEDSDLPAQPLTFSLVNAPAGASISGSGSFSWGPSAGQAGTYDVTIRLSDTIANDDHLLQIIVTGINTPPVLSDVPASATIPELSLYTFDANATDSDVPAQDLVFSLIGAPPDASIDPSTGVFTWTPTEADGGVGMGWEFIVRVSDGIANTDQAVSLTVTEVNDVPDLTDVPLAATIPELSPYTFDAKAIDVDLPPQTLTFSLDGAPSGAAIDPTTGVFTWTPTEEQGGTETPYVFTVLLSDTIATKAQEVSLTVTEVNVPPVLGEDVADTIVESAPWSYDAHAIDPDIPLTLIYVLTGAPDGMSISDTGIISWSPTEAQGPGVYPVTVHVSDGSASDEQLITVTVAELNQPPLILDLPTEIVVPELIVVYLDLSASDPDLPPQELTFSLVEPYPASMTIDSSSGVLVWQATEADGPGSLVITISVSDGVTATSQAMTWTISEVNTPPVLSGVPSSLEVTQTFLANFDAEATDSDLPPNTLTFSLIDAPAGAAIDPETGVFNWTPTVDQSGPYTFTVRVSDGTGAPNANTDAEVTIVVVALNTPPTLDGVPDSVTIPEMQAYTFTAVATDDPLQTLEFSLVGAPPGAEIDPSTGVFTWRPSETQGPGSYGFIVRVSDGTESAEHPITIEVTEANLAPVVSDVPESWTFDELTEWSFTASASDRDFPPQDLIFSLVDAPPGASIDPSSGHFIWTPADEQGPGTYTFSVRVSDGVASSEKAMLVTVNEINIPPVLEGVSSATFDEMTSHAFDADATDPDPHGQTLTFSLIDAPAGATIDPGTGMFSWTPTEAQGAGEYLFTVRVDDGTDHADRPITLTVNEVNLVPDLDNVPAAATLDELVTYSFTATCSDGDVPPHEQTLTFSLAGAPAGASIDASTGVFTWTPTEAQGAGAYPFSVQISDGVATHEHETTLNVLEINGAPSLAAIGSQGGVWGTLIKFDANATDPDVPENALTFSMTGAPDGATIDPATGVFMWTPTSTQVGPFSVTIIVTDDGVPQKSDSEIVAISISARATTLVYKGSTSAQYSDSAGLSAVLTDTLTGAPISGATISFTLDTQTASGLTAVNGYATPTLLLDQAPGAKTVISTFAGSAMYLGSGDSDPYTVLAEDARATYSGALFVSTACTTCTTATVTLAATIQDITAIPTDPAYDTNGGNITHATVTFVDLDTHTDIATVPVGLVYGGDTLTGAATYEWNVDLGALDEKDFTIGIRIGGWYVAEAQADAIVTVIKASLTNFISGGGYIVLSSSAGLKAGDAGSKNNFGFGVKYNKKGRNLQGRFNTIVRRTETSVLHRYQIKATAMTSLSVQPTAVGGTAVFTGKAVIQDVTNPLAPIPVDGNATLQVTMTDNGEPGSSDLIGITIWNKSGGLWYSSNWTGKKTTEKILDAGNLVVH